MGFLGLDPTSNLEVDHKDRVKDNNKLDNLRVVSHRDNQNFWMTGRLPTGVSEGSKSYRARIRYNGARIHLGSYLTIAEASEAYQKAKQQIDDGKFKTQ